MKSGQSIPSMDIMGRISKKEQNDVQPRAPSTCILRVASEKGGVESEIGAESNSEYSENGLKAVLLDAHRHILRVQESCRRAVDDPHKNMG